MRWLGKSKKDARAEVDSVLATFEQQKHRSIVDLAREQLKGFDPKLLDNADDPELMYADDDEDEGLDTFLAHCRDLQENPAFKVILQTLTRNQMLHIATESRSVEELNFGRATINGLQLLEEEVDRLVGIYNQRHAPEEEFDEHDLT